MTKINQVTEEEFNRIKPLATLPISEFKKQTGRSQIVKQWLTESSTWNDYLAIKRDHRNKYDYRDQKAYQSPLHPGSGGHNAISEEAFKQVKDLLFRGESYKAIYEQTGRASKTIKKVEQASDYQDYLQLPTPGYTPKPIVSEIKNPYDRLEVVQSLLAEALSEIVIHELRQKYGELIHELETLKRKNQALVEANEEFKRELEKARRPDLKQLIESKLPGTAIQESLLDEAIRKTAPKNQ